MYKKHKNSKALNHESGLEYIDRKNFGYFLVWLVVLLLLSLSGFTYVGGKWKDGLEKGGTASGTVPKPEIKNVDDRFNSRNAISEESISSSKSSFSDKNMLNFNLFLLFSRVILGLSISVKLLAMISILMVLPYSFTDSYTKFKVKSKLTKISLYLEIIFGVVQSVVVVVYLLVWKDQANFEFDNVDPLSDSIDYPKEELDFLEMNDWEAFTKIEQLDALQQNESTFIPKVISTQDKSLILYQHFYLVLASAVLSFIIAGILVMFGKVAEPLRGIEAERENYVLLWTETLERSGKVEGEWGQVSQLQ